MDRWLAWICRAPAPVPGILQGILSPLTLAIFFAILPWFLRGISTLQSPLDFCGCRLFQVWPGTKISPSTRISRSACTSDIIHSWLCMSTLPAHQYCLFPILRTFSDMVFLWLHSLQDLLQRPRMCGLFIL